MFALTDEDRAIQQAARVFADELIPLEVDVELAGGVVAREVAERNHAEALARGLYATNMPKSVGGPGRTMLQQVLVQEQVGRVTNGLAWVMHTPPAWWAEVATDFQRDGGCFRPSAANGTSATRSPRSSPVRTSMRSPRLPSETATTT